MIVASLCSVRFCAPGQLRQRALTSTDTLSAAADDLLSFAPAALSFLEKASLCWQLYYLSSLFMQFMLG